MSSPISFDWSQGRAFVQEGTIFYSPNCSRTVLVPARASTKSPFEDVLLDASEFNQPVWWTDVYGWQSFIPLSPSFTSSPFEPFCWMPRIIEVDIYPHPSSEYQERRFQMHPDDFYIWSKRERLLTEAAELIRIWYKIPGNLPPPPSKFNYGRPHKSLGIAKKIISLSRDWFSVWMGFVSYLIACSKRLVPSSSSAYSVPDPNSPFPVWHQRLEETHNYPTAWLDGLLTSTICSFDSKTPRAGIIFEWSKSDKTRPDFAWFLSHNIPMWFVWSKEEERAILHDRSLSFLKPPDHIIQDALTCLFNVPSSKIPLAGLIIKNYYNMGSDPVTNDTVKLLKYKEAPTFVLNFTTQAYLDQTNALARVNTQTNDSLKYLLLAKRDEQYAASQADAALPTQTMIDNLEEKGKLYNHWREFLDRREKRQCEIFNVESDLDRQRRMSREQNPSIKNADIYTWERIQSSGGKEVYMRLRVGKKRNEDVFSSYRKHQRIYNSLTNEWDLCREFSNEPSSNFQEDKNPRQSTPSKDSDEDDTVDWIHEQYYEANVETHERIPDISSEKQTPMFEREPSPSLHAQQPCQIRQSTDFVHSTTLPSSDNMDLSDDQGINTPIIHYSRDVVETLAFGYGFIPSIPSDNEFQLIKAKEWETTLLSFGFISPETVLEVEEFEKRAIFDFYKNLVKNSALPVSSDDLNNTSHAALGHLFDFAAIHHPSSDLYVFSAPRSIACNWLLGVESAEIALYVCRYILSNPGAHTIVTVATRLLDRGIPFRTLIGMDTSARKMTLIDPYIPQSYRFSNHIFTPQDFDASMLRCQSILSQPQGRAALLKGGIIWRIAKEFLSSDGVLDGPSVEVTAHRVGYSHESGTPKVLYCDDDLTPNEIAIICGTYSLYTPLGQVSVKSWFPPPICWNKDRTGIRWIEWTSRNEQFFEDLMKNIRAGTAAPLTVVEWTSRLRGWKLARKVRDSNRKRSISFLETLVPTPKKAIP